MKAVQGGVQADQSVTSFFLRWTGCSCLRNEGDFLWSRGGGQGRALIGCGRTRTTDSTSRKILKLDVRIITRDLQC